MGVTFDDDRSFVRLDAVVIVGWNNSFISDCFVEIGVVFGFDNLMVSTGGRTFMFEIF